MRRKSPRVVFVNPCRVTTGTAFVMPAAQVTLAGAIPSGLSVEPIVIDEAVQRFDPNLVGSGDIVCVSALTNNVREAYRVVRQVKERGATAIMGGPHPTLLPEEALDHGADAVVRGDGDVILGRVLEDAMTGNIPASKIYWDPNGNPFRVAGHEMAYPRLDLVDLRKYWTTSLQVLPGCRESCTFCTVPGIGGRIARYRSVENVAREVRELHDGGIRFVIWGADNLIQTPLSLIKATRNAEERKKLEADRETSLAYLEQFAKLTGEKKCWGFAQLTLRLHDDDEVLDAIRNAGICAALFGIESIDPEALRRMAKQWNGTAAEMIEKIGRIQGHGIHVLGSMIVGLPTDTPETIDAMRRFSVASGMSVAQYPTLEILPGSPDYQGAKRELRERSRATEFPIASGDRKPGVKLLRDKYWLDSEEPTPHLEHPTFTVEQVREEGRKSWRYFYRLSHLLKNGLRHGWPLRGIVTYAIGCKLFAWFYGGSVGLSVDSARAGNASFLEKRLMAIGTWRMHKIKPPKTITS